VSDLAELLDIPRIVISASGSSSGKTMISSGLAKCLVKRGFKVQTFKVGPDFIDPQYLTMASGRQCVNLDSWLMSEEEMLRDFVEYARGADIALIEGVRSLYDSGDPLSLRGSTWLVAKVLRAPVLLVVDVSGINMGAAAIAKGFSTLTEGVRVEGVVLNKVRSFIHMVKAKAAVEKMAGIPVIGAIPVLSELKVEMRHLGLRPALEKRAKALESIEKWREIVECNLNVRLIEDIAKSAPPIRLERKTSRRRPKGKVKVAVALDEAFNFYYRQNMDLLEALGAELVPFSPLTSSSLSEASGVLMGGGYPQLFLVQLEGNESLRRSLKKLVEDECPTYAECGGLMYLCEEIEDFSGVKVRGVSVIPGRCSISRSTRFLGYTRHRVVRDNPLSKAGGEVKGHEFHYSSIEVRGEVKYAYEVLRGYGVDGRHDGIVTHEALASYTHVLASGQEHLFERFLEKCLAYSRR